MTILNAHTIYHKDKHLPKATKTLVEKKLNILRKFI